MAARPDVFDDGAQVIQTISLYLYDGLGRQELQREGIIQRWFDVLYMSLSRDNSK